MSRVIEVQLRDGTYVNAMDCVRRGEWSPIERAFTELHEELQAARRTVSGQKPAAYKVTTKERHYVWFTEAKNQADHTRSQGHQVEELYAAPIPSTVSGQEAIGFYHRYKLSETRWFDWMPCSEKNARLYSDLPKFEVAMFYRNTAPIPATE